MHEMSSMIVAKRGLCSEEKEMSREGLEKQVDFVPGLEM